MTTPLACKDPSRRCNVARPSTANLSALAARTAAEVTRRPDADALRAAALIDLLWPADTGKSFDRAISYLRRAAASDTRSVEVLTDLSGALLGRATRTDNAADVLEALDIVDRALELRPQGAPAAYNRAVALERLGLDQEAANAWRAYLAIDSSSAWAGEARAQSANLAREIQQAGTSGPATDVAAYVSSSHQRARVTGCDTLLVQWARAVIDGDSTAAKHLFDRAVSIGSALVEQGGDAALLDATTVIQAATSAHGVRSIAAAYQAYGAGLAQLKAGSYFAAWKSFERAKTFTSSKDPLRYSVEIGALTARLSIEGAVAVLPLADDIVNSMDTARYPALAARARWADATTLIRAGQPEKALHLIESAQRLFKRAGESENLGAMYLMAGDALYAAGDIAAMHDPMHQGLEELRRHTGSIWLHSLLYIWAEAIASEWPRAAADLQQEGISAAVANGSDAVIAEARLARARLAIAYGDSARARGEISLAVPFLARLPAGPRREWLEADLALADAGLSLHDASGRALIGLDTAVARFQRTTNVARLLPALVARAEARLALHHEAEAEADLEHAIHLVQAQHDLIQNVRFRATMLEAARRTVDELVMHRIARGEIASALAYVDRTRGSLLDADRTSPAGTAIATPTGESALEFALVGDTLLAWSVIGTEARLVRSVVSRDSLSSRIERVRASLELRSGDSLLRSDLSQLYDTFIRPSATRLGLADSMVTIVADGEIEKIPFAALFDRTTDRYLVESHPLRFATRLGGLARERPAAHTIDRALLVADPAASPSNTRALPPLPGARAEVTAISKEYGSPRILEGAAATREAMESDLRGMDVIHFAGHAVFDDNRPERSYLALAAGDGESGQLTTSDIAKLDLHGSSLVVLSACETARVQEGRSGGLMGLTGAFLLAGARGVVGTLWRVEDDSATQRMMVDLHRAFRTTRRAAVSVRRAQLEALASSDPRRRSPATWAAFRYNGI